MNVDFCKQCDNLLYLYEDPETKKIMNAADKEPVRPSSRVPTRADGKLATIPAKIINEIPFPTPLEVICSPNHIKNIVPPTKVTTVVKRKNKPGSITAEP